MRAELKTFPPEIIEHLTSFKREVERALPGRVAQVTLFGSRARGDAEEDSDYDVAIFVAGLRDAWQVTETVSAVAFPHMLEGVHISPIVLSADDLDSSRTELAAEIAKEGIVLP